MRRPVRTKDSHSLSQTAVVSDIDHSWYPLIRTMSNKWSTAQNKWSVVFYIFDPNFLQHHFSPVQSLVCEKIVNLSPTIRTNTFPILTDQQLKCTRYWFSRSNLCPISFQHSPIIDSQKIYNWSPIIRTNTFHVIDQKPKTMVYSFLEIQILSKTIQHSPIIDL